MRAALRGLWSGQPKASAPKLFKGIPRWAVRGRPPRDGHLDPGLQKDIAGRIDQNSKELI